MAMLMQGKYATGQIVGQYEVGGVVNIAVQVSTGSTTLYSDIMLVTMWQVTANHGGHFTFRVCPVSRGGDPSQDCLDTNLLTVLNTVNS